MNHHINNCQRAVSSSNLIRPRIQRAIQRQLRVFRETQKAETSLHLLPNTGKRPKPWHQLEFNGHTRKKERRGGGPRTWRRDGAKPVIMLPSNMAVINEMLTLDESAVFHCDQHDISILWLLPLWLIRWRAAALIPVIRMSLSR